MSFATGLASGTAAGKSWINSYKDAKEESITNQLFKAGMELQQEGEQIDAEGNKIKRDAMNFANMSGDQITNSMLQQITANGGKIDDQTYRIAYQVGNLFQEKKQEVSLFNEKKRLYDAKVSNVYNTINNRNRRTSYLNNKPYYNPKKNSVTGSYKNKKPKYNATTNALSGVSSDYLNRAIDDYESTGRKVNTNEDASDAVNLFKKKNRRTGTGGGSSVDSLYADIPTTTPTKRKAIGLATGKADGTYTQKDGTEVEVIDGKVYTK